MGAAARPVNIFGNRAAERNGATALRGRTPNPFGRREDRPSRPEEAPEPAAERKGFGALRRPKKKNPFVISKPSNELKPLEVHQPQSEDQLVETIFKRSTDVKAFGGGAASNVVRFLLREESKGGSSALIQSSRRDSDQVDYVFYARMNMCSARAFAAVRDFCQQVVSHVSTSPDWTTKARIHVPRILLNVDRSQTKLFDRLYQWMKDQHTNAGKAFNGDDQFGSITIVEGTSAVPIGELMAFQGKWPKDMTIHAMELGLLHALDVAIGMGDRFQNPNPGNVTVNPRSGQPVLIDVDTFLPPTGLGPAIEQACLLESNDPGWQFYGKPKNERWAKHQNAWPPCPPRIPFQGSYKKDVDSALEFDLALYYDHLAKNRDEVGTSGVYHQERAMPMAYVAFKNYHEKLSSQQLVARFRTAAVHVLKIIAEGVNDGIFKLDVEDDTCSGARLKERVNQWAF